MWAWRELRVALAAAQMEHQELRNPHRQMMVGMVVLAKSHLVVTASPEEVRGWHWLHDGSLPAQLWVVPVHAATSVVCLSNGGTSNHLLVLGQQEGNMVHPT